MISNRMTRAEMIKWLGDAIRTETEKPFDDIDHDFVDECSCLLVELMGETAVMSEDEIAERMAKLNPVKVAPKKTGIKLKKMWKIAIAAAVVLCMGITVLAVPAWRQAILTALQLDVGESTEIDGITWIRNGTEQSYSSIEELLMNEDLDFSLPRYHSESLKLKKIANIGEINNVVLYFNMASLSYSIWLNNTDIASYTKNSTEYHINGHTTYIITIDTAETRTYHSYTLIGNDIHNIVTDNLENLELLINSID